MQKSKITADVAVMPYVLLKPLPCRGVKDLHIHLHHLPNRMSSLPPTSQLRSRRLEKLPLLEQQNVHLLFQRETEESGRCCRKRRKSSNCRPNSKLRFDSFASESVITGYEKDEEEMGFDVQVEDNRNLARCKPSFAESHLEFDEGNWSTYSLPTSNEVEEFFASAKRKQQRLFIEKYNFDIVNDAPLSGRYEWVE